MVHFTAAVYKSALLTLGVPPGGHHPPPRSSKKDSWSKVAGRVQGDDRVSCVSNCRRSRLASRVRQYSPRTPLSASNRIMLRQSHCRLGSSLKGGEAPLDSLSASACSQRKDLGHSLCLPSAQGPSGILRRRPAVLWPALPVSGVGLPVRRPLSSSSSAVPASGRLRLPVVLASVQIPPLLSPVRSPCPSVFVSVSLRCSCPAGLCPAHPLRRFLSLDLPSPGPLSSSLPSPCSPVSVPRTTASITLPKWH